MKTNNWVVLGIILFAKHLMILINYQPVTRLVNYKLMIHHHQNNASTDRGRM